MKRGPKPLKRNRCPRHSEAKFRGGRGEWVCRSCRRERSRVQREKPYYQKYMDSYVRRWRKSAAGRNSRLKAAYGITLQIYNMLLGQQGNACSICRRSVLSTRERKLHVDHDHKTGRVRGLLCRRCNLFLGYLENDPNMVAKAVRYLNKKEIA